MSRFAHSPASYSPIMFLSVLHCPAKAKRYGDHASPPDRVVTNDLPYQTSHPVAIPLVAFCIFAVTLFFLSSPRYPANEHDKHFVQPAQPAGDKYWATSSPWVVTIWFAFFFFFGTAHLWGGRMEAKPFKEHLSPSAHTSAVVLGEICIIQLECF